MNNNLDIFVQISKKKLSSLEAMRTLMSCPYTDFVSELFLRTREYELGLDFLDICRNLLEEYIVDIPIEEAQNIEHHINFMELNFYDYLNQWQQYLDFFEYIFLEKRSKPYILTYCFNPNQNAQERFGRYLLSYKSNGLLVHQLYLHEDRRAIIKRKLTKQEFGKNVEHLKRHQKEQLSNEEYLKRIEEIKYFFACINKYK